jgi:outer membrane protein assembly factor BamB
LGVIPLKKMTDVLITTLVLLFVFLSFIYINSYTVKAAGLADSPWPMYYHDAKHTGLSQYDTSENQGNIKWMLEIDGSVFGPIAISTDGTIIFGSGTRPCIKAVNPNGTMRWGADFPHPSAVTSSPAVDKDGTIYVGSGAKYCFSAINSFGMVKWSITDYQPSISSPTIGNDGTIYVGTHHNALIAVNSDGTLKWTYEIGFDVGTESSPAIGDDGTIYLSATDGTLYAINPDGTLEWEYNLGSHYRSSPSIGADGTIYISADVEGYQQSFLYALNPSGTLKWKCETSAVSFRAPAIGPDGTIYVSSDDGFLYAISSDGISKWNQLVAGSSLAIGAEGTIYCSTYNFDSEPNYLYAINPDGSTKWRLQIEGWPSAPVIGSDGIIYLGVEKNLTDGDGYLYAIGEDIVDENDNGNSNIDNSGELTTNDKGNGTPGFELILVVFAIALVFIWKRKRYN